MNKRICIIQTNYTDLELYNIKYNCISRLKESNIFDKIVLAAPNIKENLILIEFAKKHDIDVFFGEISNVTKRMLDCCKQYEAKLAARILINWFFLDINLVSHMVQLLENTKADYINLPRNFDIRFGADVFSANFLRKVLDNFRKENTEDNKLLFNPWGYADAYLEKFNIITCNKTPKYSYEHFQKVRKISSEVWPERHDPSFAPLFTYKKVLNYVKSGRNSRILDIACGLGYGTSYLAEHCGEVYGIDIDEDTIIKARNRFPKPNIKFEVGNAEELKFPDKYFDAIISIHTMEHLNNDHKFLQRCSDLLKSDGLLIIEVPKLRELPFMVVDVPLSKYHKREYNIENFTEVLGKCYDIVKLFGVSRGFYVSLEKSREALMAICEKKGESHWK